MRTDRIREIRSCKLFRCARHRALSVVAVGGLLLLLLAAPNQAQHGGGPPDWVPPQSADLDGDAFLDFMVAFPSGQGNGSGPGEVYIVSGSDESVLNILVGSTTQDWFGYAVAVVGDLNGDGLDDLLVGAPKDETGKAFVFYGTFGVAPIVITADNADMVFVNPSAMVFDFGEAVGPVSDLDLDSVPELRIRGWFFDDLGSLVPRTYIYSGATGLLKFSIIGDNPFDPWAVVEGDADGDGDVDGDDLAIVQANLGLAGPGLTTYDGDFNGDGVVDAADVAIAGQNMGFGLFDGFDDDLIGGGPCGNGHWVYDCNCVLMCAPIGDPGCLPPEECEDPPGLECQAPIADCQPLYPLLQEVTLHLAAWAGDWRWAGTEGAEHIQVLSGYFDTFFTFVTLSVGSVKIETQCPNADNQYFTWDYCNFFIDSDNDGDGVSTACEMAWGTDPYDPNSFPDPNMDEDGDGISDVFELCNCAQYPLPIEHTDTDNDGISDAVEVCIWGTNQGFFDTDGDGLPDGWEIQYGLDPINPDTDGDGIPDGEDDLDGDGLSNHDEFIYGTDPTNPDTDGDGVSDYDEVQQGSNPNDPADGGQAPDPQDLVTVTLVVGDHSGSHSEFWMLEVGDINFKAPDYGEVTPPTDFLFLRGHSYPIKLTWLGTNLQEGPDYDYTAHVTPASGSCAIVDDPQNLLGVVNNNNPPPNENWAANKEAMLVLGNGTVNIVVAVPNLTYHDAASMDVITITAYSEAPNDPLICVRWQRRFNDGLWEHVASTEATAELPWSSPPGIYRYRARIAPGDPWVESSDICIAKVTIPRIWSDQIPDNDCNHLELPLLNPVNKKGYMLVGVRADDRVYFKAELTITPDVPAVRNLLHVGYAEDTAPWTPFPGATTSINGTTASVVTAPGAVHSHEKFHTIVIGFDYNVNWVFDPDEVVEHSAWRYRPVHGIHADGARFALLELATLGGWAQLNIASDNLLAFVTNVPPTLASSVGRSTVANADPDLEFAVGLIYDGTCTATVNEYHYASVTEVAEEVANSNTMVLSVQALFATNSSQVINDLVNQPGVNQFIYNWPLVIDAFDYAGNGDTDLHLAFGRAHLNSQVTVTVERTGPDTGIVSNVVVSGNQYDLYDWDYDIGFPDFLCAILQTMYPIFSGGNAGAVYRNNVHLNNSVTALESVYQFGP